MNGNSTKLQKLILKGKKSLVMSLHLDQWHKLHGFIIKEGCLFVLHVLFHIVIPNHGSSHPTLGTSRKPRMWMGVVSWFHNV
jgi:hypothetical protein